MTPAEREVQAFVKAACGLRKTAKMREASIAELQAVADADSDMVPWCRVQIEREKREIERLDRSAEWHISMAQCRLRAIDARQKGEAA
jgi:hypothetical protein